MNAWKRACSGAAVPFWATLFCMAGSDVGTESGVQFRLLNFPSSYVCHNDGIRLQIIDESTVEGENEAVIGFRSYYQKLHCRISL